MHMQEFCQMLQYLLATNSIDIIAAGVNYDLLKVSEQIFRYFHRPYVTCCRKKGHAVLRIQPRFDISNLV